MEKENNFFRGEGKGDKYLEKESSFFEEMKNEEGKRAKYLEIKTLFFEVKEKEKNILRRKKNCGKEKQRMKWRKIFEKRKILSLQGEEERKRKRRKI